MHLQGLTLGRRLAIALSALVAASALASSHREAPFVTEHPKVDGTDFYMFRSYEPGRSDYVTIVADYIPLQDAYGGPNFFFMDQEALYEIHIDNDGDGREDITFQFQFRNRLKDIALDIGPAGDQRHVSVPVINVGPLGVGNTGALNIDQTYTVTMVRGHHRDGEHHAIVDAHTGGHVFVKPVDNIGMKSIPDYPGYAAQYVYDIRLPGCDQVGRMFVGQRKDPFVVNLGEAFDLVNIDNPLGDPNAEADSLADKNVTALILELPISSLVKGNNPIIGGWTTASMRQSRVLRTVPTYQEPAIERGPWVQVSRLGMPLVNELVIGLKDKDKFNASEPKDDAQFADYVTHPTFPAILEILFGSAGVRAPTLFPRTDLVAVFLTGIDGLNKTSPAAAEMLRLNTSIPPVPPEQQNYLGVIGGDLAGFPNGRRPGDDVVDIALRVVMGKLLDLQHAPSGQLPFTDGALCTPQLFDPTFPYLRTPIPGSPNNTPAASVEAPATETSIGAQRR